MADKVKNFDNADKDHRYMAVSDLLTEASKSNWVPPSGDQATRLCDAVVERLDDASGDISALAVKWCGCPFFADSAGPRPCSLSWLVQKMASAGNTCPFCIAMQSLQHMLRLQARCCYLCGVMACLGSLPVHFPAPPSVTRYLCMPVERMCHDKGHSKRQIAKQLACCCTCSLKPRMLRTHIVHHCAIHSVAPFLLCMVKALQNSAHNFSQLESDSTEVCFLQCDNAGDQDGPQRQQCWQDDRRSRKAPAQALG